MAYPLRVRETAFELWLKGLSVERIVAHLRGSDPACARLSVGAVEAWSKRETWRTRRDQIHRHAQAQLDEARADFEGKVLGDLVKIRQRLAAYCTTKNAPRSLEGGIDSLVKVIRLERQLRDLDKPKAPPIRIAEAQILVVVDKVFDLLQEEPAVRPILERLRGQMARRIVDGIQRPAPEKAAPDP